ncbi:aminotransferase class III-fold pyridoxal phosphate-dependent enzyme [Streptomyces sp. ISL-98]|nr:aminotransferase class III-fold pyridoxal phosphate-dependent enzyme [Streptomyces sp. ISL-98]
MGGIAIFDAVESEVRSYCRTWPLVFDRAEGSWITDESGHRYLDFFAGAGGINYGHNNPLLKDELLDYITAPAGSPRAGRTTPKNLPSNRGWQTAAPSWSWRSCGPRSCPRPGC